MAIKRKIPKFNSIREEAAFWDSHDVTDYLSETKLVDSVVDFSSEKKETMTIRIQPKVKKKLTRVAKNYGITPSALTRLWITDKLKESSLAQELRDRE